GRAGAGDCRGPQPLVSTGRARSPSLPSRARLPRGVLRLPVRRPDRRSGLSAELAAQAAPAIGNSRRRAADGGALLGCLIAASTGLAGTFARDRSSVLAVYRSARDVRRRRASG